MAPDVWGRLVAGGGAAAIVEEAGRHAGRLTGGAPRRAPAADGDAVAVEDQRAVGVAAHPSALQGLGNRLRHGEHPPHQGLRAGRREPDDAAGLVDLVPGEAEDLMLAPAGVVAFTVAAVIVSAQNDAAEAPVVSVFVKFSGTDYLKGKYSREHAWVFDGGVNVPASAAPSAVPAPYSNPACVDPEEAFVASLSSCHMLTYLFVAQKQGFEIDNYDDEAVGHVVKNEQGRMWVSEVTLRPRVVYSGESQPSAADEDRLHRAAHDHCFIANSIKTEIKVEPRRNEGHGLRLRG